RTHQGFRIIRPRPAHPRVPARICDRDDQPHTRLSRATLVVLESPDAVRSEPMGYATFSWRALLEIIQALALAVVISVVLNLFIVQVTEVRQRSMESTLLQSDRFLVSKVD